MVQHKATFLLTETRIGRNAPDTGSSDFEPKKDEDVGVYRKREKQTVTEGLSVFLTKGIFIKLDIDSIFRKQK